MGPPVRVRQRIPSISCRLLQVGGRPGFLPLGSNGSSLAHCSLVRSPRPMTGASHETPWLLKHALGPAGFGPHRWFVDCDIVPKLYGYLDSTSGSGCSITTHGASSPRTG